MDVPLEYLRPLTQTNDEYSLIEYLSFVSESKLFCLNKSKQEDLTLLINSLLSSRETSNEGLLILNNFIKQCPKEILSANISLWIQQAVKNLVNPENGSLSTIAFKVLGLLLELSSNFSEARKHIALTIIPKVLDHLIRESKGSREDTIILNCLEQTIKNYGRSSGFHKEPVSKLIFSHLTSSPECVFIAGKCYLLLAQCGGPGANGETYVVAWMNQQKFLLNSLHAHLNHLFGNITEENDNHKKYVLENPQPIIPTVAEKSLLKRKQIITKHFGSLAEFFKILLLGSFPAKKRILPESILGLVWRGLSINCQTLAVGQQSVDVSSLMTVISKINYACLEILEALIISCSMNLISYSQLISRILTQTLKWTEIGNWPYGVTKPNSSLRVKTYECFWKWLTLSRSCSGISKHLDELIPIITSDINHNPPPVSLKVPTGKGKKRLKEMKNFKTAESSLEFLVDPRMNSESCVASLKFVSVLLNTTSTQMKPNHHEELQASVVSKLISVQQKKCPVPYSNESCRLSLYEALLSLCQNCHPTFQPPVSYASVIFSTGIKDISIEVSKFCQFSLRSIEKILRPICPSLDFPASSESMERINIFSAQEESTFLLNDSKYQKRKRNSYQATSTPINNTLKLSRTVNLSTTQTPMASYDFQNLSVFEKGVDRSFQNLSDFERGADLSMTQNDSIVTNTHGTPVMSISEIENDKYKNGNNDNDKFGENEQHSGSEIDEILPLKRRIIEKESLSESSVDFLDRSNVIQSTNKAKENTLKTSFENGQVLISSELDELNAPSNDSKSSKGSPSESYCPEEPSRNSETDTTLGNNLDSDEEMLKSFVNETIEID